MNWSQFGNAVTRGLRASWANFTRRPWMKTFEDFCRASGAGPVQFGFGCVRKAQITYGPYTIHLSSGEYEENTQTSATVYLNGPSPFTMSACSAKKLSSKLKSLIMTRFYTGYLPFDDQIAIFSTDHSELSKILGDEKLRALLVKNEDVHLQVTEEPKHESFKLTLGSEVERFRLIAESDALLTTTDRLTDLVELMKRMLDHLQNVSR